MAKIVFMGTPEFAVPSLERLARAGHVPVAVATTPDRRRGRGQKPAPSPVKEAAVRLGIETILQPESVREPAFAKRLSELEPDVIVVVAFSILPAEVFETARLGAFNLHGSLLPMYRGAAPIHRAVMAGESETGVTTFFLKERVDTGNMILQRSMPIGPDETAGDVHDRMMALGAEVVLETLERILAGRASTVPQDESRASRAPKIFRDDCRIPWASPRKVIHNFVRGLSPSPGAWTMHGEVELKLLRSRLRHERNDQTRAYPGSVVGIEPALRVAGVDGAVDILEIQQQGRRRMTAGEFLRGYALNPGDQLA
jgi:methionyl-tRNA formyltransferase